LNGGTGDDDLIGGGGNDFLRGGFGSDDVWAGAGDGDLAFSDGDGVCDVIVPGGFDDVIFDDDDLFDQFDPSGSLTTFDMSDIIYCNSSDDALGLSGGAVGYNYDGLGGMTGWFFVAGIDRSVIGPEDFTFQSPITTQKRKGRTPQDQALFAFHLDVRRLTPARA